MLQRASTGREDFLQASKQRYDSAAVLAAMDTYMLQRLGFFREKIRLDSALSGGDDERRTSEAATQAVHVWVAFGSISMSMARAKGTTASDD